MGLPLPLSQPRIHVSAHLCYIDDHIWTMDWQCHLRITPKCSPRHSGRSQRNHADQYKSWLGLRTIGYGRYWRFPRRPRGTSFASSPHEYNACFHMAGDDSCNVFTYPDRICRSWSSGIGPYLYVRHRLCHRDHAFANFVSGRGIVI